MTLLSTKIKEIIKEKGISAHALEKRAGLRPSAIQNILYGRSKNPSISTLNAIAQALGYSVAELINDSVNPNEDNVENVLFEPPEINQKNWNCSLYLDCTGTVVDIAKKSNQSISKEEIITFIDHVYSYSASQKEGIADEYFARWLFERYGYL